MAIVEEIEKMVSALPLEEYGRFRTWFLNQDWKNWDDQIEQDSEAGKLDFLFQEAAEAKKANRLKAL